MSIHFCPLTASMAELPVSPDVPKQIDLTKSIKKYTFRLSAVVCYFCGSVLCDSFKVLKIKGKTEEKERSDFVRSIPTIILKCFFLFERK